MSSATQLVEHFFRHEYGRIVALLTSRMGTVNLQIIEDAVQTAMSRALANWPRVGIPDNPSAWLFRAASNAAIDALRHEALVSKKIAQCAESSEQSAFEQVDPLENSVGDETLRFLFLCCHPAIPAESRVALALKTVGGFSVAEVAAGLLTTSASIEKKITRAKEKLRDHHADLMELGSGALDDRLESVQATVYLMFNEGYAATIGSSPIRADLCNEAIRLCRMLAAHSQCDTPSTAALLSLLLLHSARMGERTSSTGSIVLLADQNRTQWDWARVREAMDWMTRSADGDKLSRYHIEAAIAWEHSHAATFAETNWAKIVQLYNLLRKRFASPAVQLNLAIAASYAENVQRGLRMLMEISDGDRRVLRPWWDCAVAQLLARDHQKQAAISHWRDALALATNDAQKALIRRQLDAVPAHEDT